MEEKKEKKIQIKTENVAIPEIKVVGYEEQQDEENDATIDYSGAIPEIRISKKK